MFNPKSGKQLIVNCEKLETNVALLSSGRLEEYLMERHSSDPVPGNIYLGRIVNLEQKLQAAFVDIGCEKNAFLHYSDMLTGADEALDKIIESTPQPPADAKRKKRGRSKTETLLDTAIKLRKRKLNVNKSTKEQVQALLLTSGEKVPTLDEYLEQMTTSSSSMHTSL